MHLIMSNKQAINKATGRRVQEIRRLRKLTQKQLAQLLGIHAITMHSYEVGEHAIPTDKLLLLAFHLRVKLSDLIPYNEVR